MIEKRDMTTSWKEEEGEGRLEFSLKISDNIFEKNMLFNLIENRIRKKQNTY